MDDLHVQRIPTTDRRLGRHVVHDERSRRFAAALPIDTSSWHNKRVAMFDPTPNPDQIIGNCTGCQKAMAFNALRNRQPGRVMRMADADRIYSLATQLDPWEGAWPPEDTGSSGLAAAKAAQQLGYGGAYRWLFGGADEVVQAIMGGETVGVGTVWYSGMFNPQPFKGGGLIIEPSGVVAGGHQYTARGYDVTRDVVMLRCWWGSFRDVWIRREHLDALLADDGDANVQRVAV